MENLPESSNILIAPVLSERSDRFCRTLAKYNSDGSLYRATIYIGARFDALSSVACLTEEITQVLEPGNDVDIVPESIWRPLEKKTFERLTWHDAVILRALYDERLKPGMHRDQAMPLVRVIIREILEDLNR
ncbi:MAG: DUF2927 domain-containing protein [Rhodospirillales bacterium]